MVKDIEKANTSSFIIKYFRGFGQMGVASSLCYRCETACSPFTILPGRRFEGRRSRNVHSCLCHNCFNRAGLFITFNTYIYLEWISVKNKDSATKLETQCMSSIVNNANNPTTQISATELNSDIHKMKIGKPGIFVDKAIIHCQQLDLFDLK